MTHIIAEFGSSPAPEWDFEKWSRSAANAGARRVKVQVFKAEHFPPPFDEIKQRDVFPRQRLQEFGDCARAHGLTPGASVFDREAAFAAAKALDFLKLAAREQYNEKLILDVWEATQHHRRPVYRSVSILDVDDDWIGWSTWVTLFAIQEYPAAMTHSLADLFNAAAWFKRHGIRWGWSSHTTGILDCQIARWLGAEVIEKHYAVSPLDSEAGHSLTPKQFQRLVRSCG